MGFPCDVFDYGTDGGLRSFLSADRSVECGTPAYGALAAASAAVLAVVGCVGPVLAVAVVRLAAAVFFRGEFAPSSRLFHYITGGYSDQRWFWEAVLMFRKAVVVTIAVAVTDERLRSYTFSWTFALALVVSLSADTFDRPEYAQLERLSLLCLIATTNAAVLAEYIRGETVKLWVLSIAALAVNVATLVVMAATVVFSLQKDVSRKASEGVAGSHGVLLRPLLGLVNRLRRHLSERGDANAHSDVTAMRERLRHHRVSILLSALRTTVGNERQPRLINGLLKPLSNFVYSPNVGSLEAVYAMEEATATALLRRETRKNGSRVRVVFGGDNEGHLSTRLSPLNHPDVPIDDEISVLAD